MRSYDNQNSTYSVNVSMLVQMSTESAQTTRMQWHLLQISNTCRYHVLTCRQIDNIRLLEFLKYCFIAIVRLPALNF